LLLKHKCKTPNLLLFGIINLCRRQLWFRYMLWLLKGFFTVWCYEYGSGSGSRTSWACQSFVLIETVQGWSRLWLPHTFFRKVMLKPISFRFVLGRLFKVGSDLDPQFEYGSGIIIKLESWPGKIISEIYSIVVQDPNHSEMLKLYSTLDLMLSGSFRRISALSCSWNKKKKHYDSSIRFFPKA